MNHDQHGRTDQAENSGGQAENSGGHGGHGLMMIACCIPMLVIAVALVATGVVGAGFLFAAIGCTVMMAFMMRAMPGRNRNETGGGDRS